MKPINYDKFSIMWKDDVVAKVLYTSTVFKIEVNKEHIKNPFRFRDTVTRQDVLDFVSEQVFDKHNANARQILNSLGLTVYAPWDILKETNGISDRNRYWIKFEGEELSYEKDIKTRRILFERLNPA